MAKTEGRETKIDWICEQTFIGYREKVCNKRTRITSRSMGTGAFSIIHMRKANRNTKR